jgi:predicted amidophosphoribosyltransferase
MRAMRAIDLLAPPGCGVCLSGHGPVCRACLQALSLLTGTLCLRCGMPTAVEVRECRRCRGVRLGFSSARAAMAYEGRGRDLVQAFKDGGQRGLAEHAAALMALVVPAPEVDSVTWVPADRWRLIGRGYHPPELLARLLATAWDVPAVPLLEGRGRRRPQRGLDMRARRANVRDAFREIASAPRRVALIDDVHTTGATLSACSRVLAAAGAEHVHAVSLARALRGPGGR